MNLASAISLALQINDMLGVWKIIAKNKREIRAKVLISAQFIINSRNHSDDFDVSGQGKLKSQYDETLDSSDENKHSALMTHL